MILSFVFIGRAESLAEQYEGVGATSIVVSPLVVGDPSFSALPQVGDRLTLRMHPGPDIRMFRCAGRHFDFSQVGSPVLQLELDIP